MWQKRFKEYEDQGFTVVGIALDVEGVEPAKRYYDKHGVTFPALVDPNYATGFGVVPLTFFVDEHGVVQPLKNWEKRIQANQPRRPVSDQIRQQWTTPGQRLAPDRLVRLARRHAEEPQNLQVAVELASRYLDLQLSAEAASVLRPTLDLYKPLEVAKGGKPGQTRLLGQAYLQMARATVENRDDQVHYATLAYYLNPSIGFAKQISRIIAPEKFDRRPGGGFDNRFREATRRRLQQERRRWLQGD